MSNIPKEPLLLLRYLAFALRLMLKSIVVCGPVSVPAALIVFEPLRTWRHSTADIGWVPGTTVFDSLVWLVPLAASSLAACALNVTVSRNPLLMQAPAGRTRRRVLEAFAYSFVAVLAAFEFGVVLSVLIDGAQQRREAVLRRFPQLTWADIVFKEIAFSLGAAGMIPALAALLPVSVGAPLVAALGIPSSEAVKFHARLGRAAVIMLTAHGLGFVIFWFRRGDAIRSLTTWQPMGVNNLAGLISVLSVIVVAFAAHPWIRRRYYEVFYYSHIVGAFTFCVFGAAHWSYAAFYFAPATLLYAADVGTRVRQHRGGVAMTDVEVISHSLILLRVPLRQNGPSPINESLASGVYFNLSFEHGTQAHPFSALHCDDSACASDPSDNGVMETTLTQVKSYAKIYMRATGAWTDNVCANAALRSLPGVKQSCTLPFRYDGPYSTHYPDLAMGNETLLLVGGGTGVVPLIGLIQARAKHAHASRMRNENLPYLDVKLVLVCREAADVAMLRELSHLLSECGAVFSGEAAPHRDYAHGLGLPLSVTVHYTGNEDIAKVRAESRLAVRTHWDSMRQQRDEASTETEIGKGDIHDPHVWMLSADMQFQVIMLVVALIGIWLGVVIVEGTIYFSKSAPLSHASHQLRSNHTSDGHEFRRQTPPVVMQSWFRGMLLVVMMNVTAFAFTSCVGVLFANGFNVSRRSTSNSYVQAADEEGAILDDLTSCSDHVIYSDVRADLESTSQFIPADVEVRKGRPDLDMYIAEELQSLKSRSVGVEQKLSDTYARGKLRVIACGPSSLVRATEGAARRAKVPFVNGVFDMAAV